MALDENVKYDHLEELGGSDYEIVDGEPNIIGWDVKDEQGRKIGEVDDLLFDPQDRKVRYLVVDLGDNDIDLADDKKVLIPIGVAELHDSDMTEDEDEAATTGEADTEEIDTDETDADETVEHEGGEAYDEGEDEDMENDNEHGIYHVENDDDDVVLIPNITAEQLRELPAYEKGNVSPEMESTIRDIFEGAGAAGVVAYNRNEFYDHDHFDDDKFYDRGAGDSTKVPVIEENLEVGKQEVETGGARITSRLVERPVNESINLKEEHVTVERTPVDRPINPGDADAFKEEEFEMAEHAEVPVVSKEARVVEEVSLNKDVEEREETIKDTVRHTEVETERIDPEKTDIQ